MSLTDTIFALASAPGESAIAVIRISGGAVEALSRDLFCRKMGLAERRASYVSYFALGGVKVDDLIVTYFAGPRSFSGESVLELFPHGNPLIVQKILEDLEIRGLRAAEPGEFTRRAFLNGKIDLSQAEAVGELIRARSDRALAAAHELLAGGLGLRMSQMTEQLLQIIAVLEAYIDFPEEDLPPEDTGGPLAEIGALKFSVNQLLATEHYGAVLRDGVKSMILGAPNVGKSSLINALTGRRRSIVSDEAGTTRDIVSSRVMIGGYAAEILDTAGLRESSLGIESMGIELAIETAETADFFLLVHDGIHSFPEIPFSVKGRIRPANSVVVLSKGDLERVDRPVCVPDWLKDYPKVEVSTVTSMGLEVLRMQWAVQLDQLYRKGINDSITVNARHAGHLRRAAECLQSARSRLESGESAELAVAELREVVEEFSGVVGRIDNERVLDKLFAQFCIGK